MRPLLAYASDGREKRIGDAIKALGDEFKLSEEDRQALLPSGGKTVLANRVHWARTYLDRAGALKRTRRSHFTITNRGQELLAGFPDRIDNAVLRQFPVFLEFVSPRSDDSSNHSERGRSLSDKSPHHSTPEEVIQTAEMAIATSLQEQLLDRVLDLPPAFFERLVIDVIVAMGYGGDRESVARRLGKSGDEGIDGVVNEDPLGLDVVYIQAKRYSRENPIGRERIQQFAGAIVGQGASKGVFVSTSSFSRHAIEYAGRVPQRIILIDGHELARLMIRYDVGVRTERIVELKRIDLDYFDFIEA